IQTCLCANASACAPTHLPVRQRICLCANARRQAQTGADRRRQAQTGADRRKQDILVTHGYENTDWFFNMILCVFMVKNN
ncbi:MAG: hypothetical protein J7L32_01495, partial [Thermoplasmata archaeon]|nr:hypothetical protein [Thermoplasmata archaeon]